MIEERAYAKINLALHVRSRRPDGFHDLESLFAFAEDGDMLRASLREDGAIHLSIDGPFAKGLETGSGNLVVQAALALQAQSGTGKGADIRLTKNLPIASGIGGGSADAAAALRLLDRLWSLGTGQAALLAIADPLGSDVPACLVSRTLVGSGRGEALDVRDLPGLAGAPLLLVNPGVALSTGPVFRGWDGQDRGALDATSLAAIASEGRNDLQPPAIALVPEIGAVIEALGRTAGVSLARMSGSGATCFALFSDMAARDKAAVQIEADYPRWWVMATRIRGE